MQLGKAALFPGLNREKEEKEMLEAKERIYKEVPFLMLAVELFGTFEVIEDYLLNKLSGKEDLNPRPHHRHGFFNYDRKAAGRGKLSRSSGLQKLKKTNIEESEPNYLEEEEYDEKSDPFMEFFKDPSKLKKVQTESVPKEPLQKPGLSLPQRKKSFEDPAAAGKKAFFESVFPPAGPFNFSQTPEAVASGFQRWAAGPGRVRADLRVEDAAGDAEEGAER